MTGVRRRAGLALCLAALAGAAPALAIVGGAPPADPEIARHVVLLVGSRGTSCSGVAIKSDVVLTAAHCVLPGADYKLVAFDAARRPQFDDAAAVLRHPGFDLTTLLAHRATADIALIRLAAPLPAAISPAPLAPAELPVAVGDAFTLAGYGLAVQGDGSTGGTVRAATLVATGKPGSLQLRLFDPATQGARAGLGACTGDSGAPVFVTAAPHAVVAIVSWSTGPNLAPGCGGLTGVTPLGRYRAWIVETAETMHAARQP